MLHGRSRETATIQRLLAQARAGRSGALVIRGRPGSGKSALLDYAAHAATGVLRLSAVGAEAEAGLPFAAAHLLLRPALGHLRALPAVQAEAIRGAFGQSRSPRRDRFLIGLAALSLLAEYAAAGPLLCLVDDAHWLDQASADMLLFVARRLDQEGITLICAARDGDPVLAGLPGLTLGALSGADAASLLDERVGPLPARVRERIVAESEGNPLALIELAGHMDPAQRAGRITPLPLYVAGGVENRVLAAFQKRLSRLAAPTRLLLLVAAADSTRDLSTILLAAARLGASMDDLEPAERHGLVEVAGAALTFRHPLIRTAAYRSMPSSRRVAAHLALAEILSSDPERRAWHLAATATGPDERVAAELHAAAELAGARDGHADAAIAYERAAELTPDPAARSRRLGAAAGAARTAGRLAGAADLAVRAAALTCDPVELARLARIQADVEFEQSSPRLACRHLLDGVRPLAASSPLRALPVLVEAAWRVWLAGDPEIAEEVGTMIAGLSLPADLMAQPQVRVAADLIDLTTGRGTAGLRSLHLAVRGTREATAPPGESLLAASIMAMMVGDDVAAAELAGRLAAGLRARGGIGMLPHALQALAMSQIFLGEYLDAVTSASEGVRLARDTGQGHREAHCVALLAWLAAVQGDEARCRELATESAAYGLAHDIPPTGALAVWALAMLELGAGRYAKALPMFEQWPLQAFRPALAAMAAPDHVEAAVRTGRAGLAAEPMARFADWSEESGQSWASAVLLRCRALTSGDGAAEGHYLEATRLHEEGGRPFERARTELLFGEWLRRARRRADARTHLCVALRIFDQLGAAPWSSRARSELAATGGSEAGPERPLAGGLTPQELQIVRLAAAGASTREIAAQLFLSPRTVSYHLYKAYPKLGVTSRGELARLDLGGDPAGPSDHLQ